MRVMSRTESSMNKVSIPPLAGGVSGEQAQQPGQADQAEGPERPTGVCLATGPQEQPEPRSHKDG